MSRYALLGGAFTSVGGMPAPGLGVLGPGDTAIAHGEAAPPPGPNTIMVSGGDHVLVYSHDMGGSLIRKYAPDGSELPFDVPQDDEFLRIAQVLPDGQGGAFVLHTRLDLSTGFARLTPTGEVDPAWPDPGGAASQTFMARSGSGVLLARGPKVYRITADGVDPTYNSPELNSAIRGLHADPDGKVVIFGNFTSHTTPGREGIVPLNGLAPADFMLESPFAKTGTSSLTIVDAGDGKRLVFGKLAFKDGSPNINGVVRLLPSGALDTGFTPFTAPGGGTITGVAPIAGGQVIVSFSTAPRIIRLNADGSEDMVGDVPVLAGTLSRVVDAGDGKYFVIGQTSVNSQSTPQRICRCNADGTIDPTFTAPAFRNNSSVAYVSNAGVLPDGSYLVVGQFNGVLGELNTLGARIAHLASDGSLIRGAYDHARNASTSVVRVYKSGYAQQPDVAFNPEGAVLTLEYGGATNFLNADGSMYQQAGNTLYHADAATGSVHGNANLGLAANALAYDPVSDTVCVVANFAGSSITVPRILRLAADGAIDPDWQGPPNTAPWNTAAVDVFASHDGGYFVSHQNVNKFSVRRLNVNGSVDSGYPAVAALSTYTSDAQGLLLGVDYSTTEGQVKYYDQAGTLRPGFNMSGASTAPDLVNQSGGAIVANAAPQDDGGVLVVGNITGYRLRNASTEPPPYTEVWGLLRLDSAGQPVGEAPKLLPTGVYAAAPAGGNLLVAGPFRSMSAWDRGAVALRRPGGFDPVFSATPVLTEVVGTARVNAVAFMPDGRGYVGGFFDTLGVPAGSGESDQMVRGLARILPDGFPDASFKDPGLLDVQGSELPGDVSDLATLAGGGVAVAGAFNRASGLEVAGFAVFDADGGLVEAFTGAAPNGPVRAVAVQPDGKVLIGGAFSAVGDTPMSGVARYNADGSLDPSFVNPQIAVTGVEERPVVQLRLQPNGKIVAAGSFRSAGGIATGPCLRLNADGSHDTGFNTGLTGVADAVGVQPDGKVLLGSATGLMRLNADGSADAGFASPLDDQSVHSIVVNDDGSILVGGDLSAGSYAGIVRLLPDGTLDTGFPLGGAMGGAVYAIATSERLDVRARYITGLSDTMEGRDIGLTYRIAGGDPPYIVDVEGQLPPGMTFALNGRDAVVSGVPEETGRFIWQFLIRDSTQAGERLLAQLVVRPLITPYGLLGFGSDGVYRMEPDGSDSTQVLASSGSAPREIRGAARLPDGKILIYGGFNTVGGQARRGVARLHPDATLDLDFVGPESGHLHPVVTAVAQLPDGKILATSATMASPYRATAHRLNEDGTVDSGFELDPQVVMTHLGAVLPLPGGSILLGGSSIISTPGSEHTQWGSQLVIKVGADGGPVDEAFMRSLSVALPTAPLFDGSFRQWYWQFASGSFDQDRRVSIHDLLLDSHGRVLVCGSLGHRGDYLGAQYVGIVDRIFPAGGFDNTWDAVGAQKLETTPRWQNAAAFNSFLNADGVSLTATGPFTAANGSLGFVRTLDNGLPATGMVDTGWAPNRYASKLPDGRFMLGSVRVYSDGQVDPSLSPLWDAGSAYLADDNGIEGFVADGTLSVTTDASDSNDIPPVTFWGDSLIFFTGLPGAMEIVNEGLHLHGDPASRVRTVLREALRWRAALGSSFNGLSAIHDHMDFGGALSVVLRELLAEGFAFGGEAADNFRAMTRVADGLRLAGLASSQLEAHNVLAATFAFAELLRAGSIEALGEGLALNAAVTNAARAGAALVEQLLLEAEAGPAVLFAAVVREDIVAGDASGASLQAVEALREGLGLALHLNLDDGQYVAYVINTESKGVSQYANYPFNSFAKLGGRYFGMTPDGIRELDGPDDAGSPIAARFRLAMSNLGTGQLKRMIAAYLGYTSSGELRLKTITVGVDGVKQAHHYRLHAQPASAPREARVKIGQGLRSVYWGFEVESIDGAAFAIDVLDLQPLVVEARIQGEGGGKR